MRYYTYSYSPCILYDFVKEFNPAGFCDLFRIINSDNLRILFHADAGRNHRTRYRASPYLIHAYRYFTADIIFLIKSK